MRPGELLDRWASLANSVAEFSGITRRRLEAGDVIDVYACHVWPKANSGLLIEGNGDLLDIGDRLPRCRGVRLMIDRHSTESGSPRTSLVVMLEEERLRDIFAVLGADLVNVVAAEPTPDAALHRCVDRLAMWQGLFDRISPDGLSEERQRGLFGELVILESLFLRLLDPADAVAAWAGSSAAHQDFLLGGLAIEVKSSLAKRHARIIIANEKQLDERAHDCLLLASVRLDESEAHGVALPDLVAEVRTRLKSLETAVRLFDEKLLQGDYLEVHAPLYSQKWKVASTSWFNVTGDFPRLTEANLPAGVGDIRYSIIADDLGAWEQSIERVEELVKGAR